MKDPAEQVILLLAASGLTEDDIHRAIRALERLGASRTTEIVYQARKRIRTLDFTLLKQSAPLAHYSAVNDDIYRLLMLEAGLTTAEAGSRLYQSMKSSMGRQMAIPPFRPKQGFRTWLSQVLQKIAPSEVLHHATKVRNDAVHRGTKSDWPLRDRET